MNGNQNNEHEQDSETRNFDSVKFSPPKPQSPAMLVLKVLLGVVLIGGAVLLLLVAACFGMLGGFR